MATRSLDPVVYLDCVHMKLREDAVPVKAVFLATGVAMAGESATFWLYVLTKRRSGDVQDILIAFVDVRKGNPETIETVFPRSTM